MTRSQFLAMLPLDQWSFRAIWRSFVRKLHLNRKILFLFAMSRCVSFLSSRQFSGSPLSSRESSDRWKSRSMMTGEWCQSRWSDSSIYCGVSRVRVVELERFKRLVYTLHPKATSLRMHSMKKRKVTTKFTMVKKSNKTGGASWYYKIHPTHRRNTTQILYSIVRPALYLFILFFN